MSLEKICENTLDNLNNNQKSSFFVGKTLTAEHKGFKKDIHNLSGWVEEDGDISFDPRTDSAKRYAEACRNIVKEYNENKQIK